MRKLMTLTAALIIMTVTPAFAGWSEPVRISQPGRFADPQIIARGDTLHVVYEDINVTDKISYQRSTNGGLTWSPHRVLSDDSAETLFPRIIASGARLMILWKNHFYFGSPNRNNVGYSVSTNNGQTWTTARYVLNPGWQDNHYFAASGGTGLNVNIVAHTYVTDSIVFYSMRSTNFGQTWSAPQEIFRTLESGLPDQAGIDNLVHLVWEGRYDYIQRWEIRYVKSIDGGVTWSPNMMISSPDQYHSEFPSVYSSSPDRAGISWMDYKYSPYFMTGDILARQSLDSGSTWGSEQQVSLNHYALGSNDIASNGDTIHIVWEDASIDLGHRSIYYTKSTDNGITWSDPYWLDGTLDDSWTPALAAANGRVYAAWGDWRPNPDTNWVGGLFFSRWTFEPDAIGNENGENIPVNIALSAYPNPFNSSVTITYSNLRGGDIGIYDVQGKMVKTLKTGGGNYGKIIWDATDATGERVSSGIYFARARTSQNSIDLKLLYVK